MGSVVRSRDSEFKSSFKSKPVTRSVGSSGSFGLAGVAGTDGTYSDGQWMNLTTTTNTGSNVYNAYSVLNSTV